MMRRTRIGFRFLDRFVDRFHIVAIVHTLDLPAIGAEASGAVFGESQIGGAINRNMVVIVEIDQTSKLINVPPVKRLQK